jgi:hypothetical protein
VVFVAVGTVAGDLTCTQVGLRGTIFTLVGRQISMELTRAAWELAKMQYALLKGPTKSGLIMTVTKCQTSGSAVVGTRGLYIPSFFLCHKT